MEKKPWYDTKTGEVMEDQEKITEMFEQLRNEAHLFNNEELLNLRNIFFSNVSQEISDKIQFDFRINKKFFSLSILSKNTETENFMQLFNSFTNIAFSSGIDIKDDTWKQFAKSLSDEKLTSQKDNKEEASNTIIGDIETFKSILPGTYHIPNNKLANEITKDFIDEGKQTLKVSSNRSKKEILTYCTLSYEGDNFQIKGKQNFTPYDREVYNAVTSLFVAGNEIITPATVYRALNGMTETETPSPQQKGSITKSLDKMRFTRLIVDCSEELRDRKASLDGEQITAGKIDTYLLNADILTVKAGGKTETAYKINKTPALYVYSQITKQVLAISSDLLNTKHIGSNTDQNILIRGYLLRRIEVIKGKTKTSNNILYDTLFKEIQAGSLDKTQKARARKFITGLLEYWKKEHYIKGFKEYKEGKTIKGITIAV